MAFRCVRNEDTQKELKDRLTQLRKQHCLVQLYSTPEQQIKLDIKGLLEQFYTQVHELISKLQTLKDTSAAEQEEEPSDSSAEGTHEALSFLIWSGATSDSALSTWLCIGHGLLLKKNFQYEESCRVLEDRWELTQSRDGMEVLVLGLALGEMMGLHIGRFQEALSVLERSIQAASQPLSEVALQLANMKAAVLIHLMNFEECLEFCTNSVHAFRGATTTEVSYGTALYFFTASYAILPYEPQPEVKTAVQEWVASTESSDNSLIKHIRLCICAMLEVKVMNYRCAEDLIRKAEELAKRDFHNLLYEGLCSFWSYITQVAANALRGVARLQEEECLRTHFPASLLRTAILECSAVLHGGKNSTSLLPLLDIALRTITWSGPAEDNAKEIELRQLIHRLVQVNPACEVFLRNIDELEKIYLKLGQQQAAIDLRESAYHTLSERYFASLGYVNCLKALGRLYGVTNQSNKKIELYAKALRRHLATYPTDQYFCHIIEAFARCREENQRETVCEVCLEAYNFLRRNHSDSKNYCVAARALGDLYAGLKKDEKAAEIYLDSIQVTKTLGKFDDYVKFIDSLSYLVMKEKMLEIRLEAHRVLVSNASPACFNNASTLTEMCAEQPDQVLEIWMEVYGVLKAYPASPEFNRCLNSLSAFYASVNQPAKVIELRLGGHRLLLAHVKCDNFIENVDQLASCYWEMNQREQALEFRLEAHRLLLPYPASSNYRYSLDYLKTAYCKMGRVEVAVELFEETYRLLQTEGNAEHYWIAKALRNLYGEVHNEEARIQLALKIASITEPPTYEHRENLALLADLYVNSHQTEAAVELYCKALQSLKDRHAYRQLYSTLDLLFIISTKEFGLWKRAVGTGLEMIRALEQAREETISEEAIDMLINFITGSIEDRKEIEECTKALTLLEPLCSNTLRMAKIFYQVGRLHLERNDCGKAEMYIQRTARIALLCSPSRSCIQRTGENLREIYGS